MINFALGLIVGILLAGAGLPALTRRPAGSAKTQMKTVAIGDKDYPMLFNANVVAAIDKKFGGLVKLGQALQRRPAMFVDIYPWLVAELTAQGVALRNAETGARDRPLTEEEVKLRMTLPQFMKQQAMVAKYMEDAGQESLK